MEQRKLNEADAYAPLRKVAMAQNRKIVDIPRSLLTATDLLKP